ncbi:MAG: B12-binding domain-containing radical SAM protein [Spirochaetota bacterium]
MQTLKDQKTFSFIEKLPQEIKYAVIVHPFTYKYPTYTLPPIHAEYAQAALISCGIETELFDMRFEEDIREALTKADLVCLLGHSEITPLFTLPSHHLIPEILQFIPEETPVIAGGTGFLQIEDSFAQYPKIDLVLIGSPEKSLLELVQGKDLMQIQNLVCRTDQDLFHTPKILNHLSEDIFPQRHLRKAKYHYHVGGNKVDLIKTAVGCNFKCKFCYEYGKDLEGNFTRWNGRSVESLITEIEQSNADIIGLVDDDFMTDIRKIDALCDAILAKKIRKIFIGLARIDHIVRGGLPLLQKMERAGFVYISMGIESLEESTLRLYKKGLTLKKIESGLALLNQTNILIQCTFLIGSPGEKEEHMMQILDFARKWNVDSIGTNRIRIPESSPLFPLITDPMSKEVLPTYTMIQGDELARIKYKIKFGQRTPTKLFLSLLKLSKHKGMVINPFLIFFRALHTFSQGTFVQSFFPSRIFLQAMLYLANRKWVFHCNRLLSHVLYPMIYWPNKLWEKIDSKIHISTFVLPKLFTFLNRKIYRKQRDSIQIDGYMQKLNTRKKEYVC